MVSLDIGVKSVECYDFFLFVDSCGVGWAYASLTHWRGATAVGRVTALVGARHAHARGPRRLADASLSVALVAGTW